MARLTFEAVKEQFATLTITLHRESKGYSVNTLNGVVKFQNLTVALEWLEERKVIEEEINQPVKLPNCDPFTGMPIVEALQTQACGSISRPRTVEEFKTRLENSFTLTMEYRGYEIDLFDMSALALNCKFSIRQLKIYEFDNLNMVMAWRKACRVIDHIYSQDSGDVREDHQYYPDCLLVQVWAENKIDEDKAIKEFNRREIKARLKARSAIAS